MIDFINETDYAVKSILFDAVYAHLSDRDIECVIVDSETMTSINKQSRGIDKATDVLSFPLEATPSNEMLGTIVICYDIAREFAEKLGHTVESELQLLFIHGMLHLLGYDHEIDNGEMRLKEEAVIKHFNLPDSLIVRNQE